LNSIEASRPRPHADALRKPTTESTRKLSAIAPPRLKTDMMASAGNPAADFR